MRWLTRWWLSLSPRVAVSLCDDAFFFQKHGGTEVVRISACIGVRKEDGKIVAVGDDVAEWGAHPGLEKVRVTESGEVIHIAGAGKILRKGFHQLCGRRGRPKVVATTCVVGERGFRLQQALVEAGASEVWLMETTLASLIGLVASVERPEPSAVIIVSNDWFAFGIASLGTLVASCRGSIGLEEIVSDIRIHSRLTRNFVPDTREVASALLRYGFSHPSDLPVAGWSAWLGKAGLGERVNRALDAECVRDGALPAVLRISERVKNLFESLPLETRAQLHSTPIEATGCAMEIPGFARMLERQLGIPVRCHGSMHPPSIAGAMRAIDELPKLKVVKRIQQA